MKAITRSAQRSLARRVSKPFRLELETLENRLLPGNTLAAVLTGSAVLGASRLREDERGSVQSVALIRHQDGAAQPAAGDHLVGQNRDGAMGILVTLPARAGSQHGAVPVRTGKDLLNQGRITWPGEDDLLDGWGLEAAQGKPARGLAPLPAAPLSQWVWSGESAAPSTAPRTGQEFGQGAGASPVSAETPSEGAATLDALAVFLASQGTGSHRGGGNPPPPDPPPPGYFSADNVDEIPLPVDPSQPCNSPCCKSDRGHPPGGPHPSGTSGIGGGTDSGIGGVNGISNSGTHGIGGISNSGLGTDTVIRRDANNGDKGCAVTEQPVRAFDGMPAITATDLSSDSLGFTWGQTRSWTGLNNSSLNGNGWAISQLPYLVVGGGTNGSCDPMMMCDGVMPGTTPDDRISVVEGGTNVHTFIIPTSGPYTSYAPWGSEKTTLIWVSSANPPVVDLTDSYGDVTQFYDVYRDGTGRPVPHSLGVDQAHEYGRFKSYTTADGSTQVNATYDSNGFLTTVTRGPSATAITEEMVYTYATVTNDLVTAAGDTPPQLLASVTLQRPDGMGGWIPAQRALYTYYTGRISNGMGGWLNDPNGRLGDLQLVQLQNALIGQGSPVTWQGVDTIYYRYYKLTGESDNTTSKGPTNKSSTTGGPDPIQPSDTYDEFVFSGLKTVVEGPSLARLAAVVPNYVSASDAALMPYVNHFFTYERWADHIGADGSTAYGSAYYNQGNNFYWRRGYRLGSRYRTTQEVAQEAGCSSCTGGQGTYKYEYAANYRGDDTTPDGIGYNTLEYNTWRMKTTEFLPGTSSDWALHDRQIVYTNEEGQPMLQVFVHTSGISQGVTAMVYSGTTSVGSIYTVTVPSHGLNTGDVVALNGILPQFFDVVFGVTILDSNRFNITLPFDYYGSIGSPSPYINQTIGGTLIHTTLSKVLGQWATFTQYDSQGRVILQAQTSAISGYDDQYDDLLHKTGSQYQYLNNSSGLIQTTTYATMTTATEGMAGSVAGYVSQRSIEQGQTGTPVLREAQTYFAHSGNGTTYYPVANDAVYGLDSGGDARTTMYHYTWLPNSTQMQSEMVSRPVISSSQNGPGTADVETTFFDSQGRPIWDMDPDGHISYAAYDAGTGEPIKMIQDVNYASLSPSEQDSFNMTGWSPPMNGLHLVTTMQVDSLGRVTEQTDPNRNVTYVVYIDPNHERRTYPGWSPDTHTTTGPIQVERQYWPAAGAPIGQQTVYNETLTSSAAPTYDMTSNAPTGQETINQTNIQTLARDLTNTGGQVVESDAYFSLAGVTYSSATAQLGTASNNSASGNYHATLYGYDDRGRPDRVQEATGTIHRTVYDGLSRVVSTWVGTNDTTTTQVNLASAFTMNTIGISTDGTPFTGGGLDGSARAYSSSFFPNSRVTWNTLPFTVGPADMANVVVASGQTFTLPHGNATALILLATAVGGVNGGEMNQSFTVTYTDGSTQTFTQSLSDWMTPRNYPGESTALTMGHFNNADGTSTQQQVNLYAYTFTLDPSRQVQSLKLPLAPSMGGVVLLAATLTNADWSPANTAPSNMSQVSASIYDGGGVGDSNMTSHVDYPTPPTAANPNPADQRETDYLYDWRDRQAAAKQGVQASGDTTTHRPIFYTQYDNLNEVTTQERFDADTIPLNQFLDGNGMPNMMYLMDLRAETTTAYDDQGRVFRSNVFSVDQTNGTVSANSLKTNYWYDHRGNLLKTSVPGGLVTKTQYDGANRAVKVFTTDDVANPTWADAGTVANNHVLTQTETTYDNDGNPYIVTTRDRFHNATALGDLSVPNPPQARTSYVQNFYDAANRLFESVNIGTNGGSVFYPFPTPPPASTSTYLVTLTAYNAAGWVQDVTDPRGIVQRTLYDLLGRTTKTIVNFQGDGIPTNTTNRTTAYTYDGANHVLTLTAVLPSNVTQQTQYVYGITPGTGSAISSNDLLRSMIYPPTGVRTTEGYSYNAVGQVITKTERNFNTVQNLPQTHVYRYDVLGRQTADSVTILGSGVNGQITELDTGYATGGQPSLFTSECCSGGACVVRNQVQRVYDGLGQLTAEYQAHGGVVGMGTPVVQYAYSFNPAAGGANQSRLVSMTYPASPTYPTGRVISYNYASGLDDSISRLTAIMDGPTVLEQYAYLGLSTVVLRSRPQPGVDLSYIQQAGDSGTGDAGDQYTGLDRYGRVVDQRWIPTTNPQSPIDRFQYTYDYDSNPLTRTNLVNSTFNEQYGYDQFNQVTSFTRGSHTQTWNLDALGNWTGFTNDGMTPQSRTFNAQNQIVQFNSQTVQWYDANGNTTTDDQGTTYVYDAWNRLVQETTTGGMTTVFTYDALGRRITVSVNGGPVMDLYYSSSWQVVEEQSGGQMQAQYVWSPIYPDALIERDTNGGPRLYVQQDADWNVTALVDTTGTVRERYVYDPYGKPTFLAPNWTGLSSSAFGWVYLHQGGRYDVASGLYNFRMRDLSPTLGRWMEQDPIGYTAGDLDLYGYEFDGPTSRVDPYGLLAPLPPPGPWYATPWTAIGGVAVFGAGVLGWETWEWIDAVREGHRLDRIRIRRKRQYNPKPRPYRKPEPKPDDVPPRDYCNKLYTQCLHTTLADCPGAQHGHSRCQTCFEFCIAFGGLWKGQVTTLSDRVLRCDFWNFPASRH